MGAAAVELWTASRRCWTQPTRLELVTSAFEREGRGWDAFRTLHGWKLRMQEIAPCGSAAGVRVPLLRLVGRVADASASNCVLAVPHLMVTARILPAGQWLLPHSFLGRLPHRPAEERLLDDLAVSNSRFQRIGKELQRLRQLGAVARRPKRNADPRRCCVSHRECIGAPYSQSMAQD